MSTNTEAKQINLRAKTGTTGTYDGDWHAYWDFLGNVTGKTFDERMLQWINNVLASSYKTVNEAQQAYAVNKGFANWDSINNLGLP